MRRGAWMAAVGMLAGCAAGGTRGRVVAHQDRGEEQDRPTVLVEYRSAGALRERAAAPAGATEAEEVACAPPSGELLVHTAVGSADHANPENFRVTVDVPGRQLLVVRGSPMPARPCGYGCGPTTGLGRLRRRAPCYCSGFAVSLPEPAPRYEVAVTDLATGGWSRFTVHVDPADPEPAGERGAEETTRAPCRPSSPVARESWPDSPAVAVPAAGPGR